MNENLLTEYVPIKAAVQMLDRCFSHKTQCQINQYCIEDKIDCIRDKNRWFINKQFIVQALEWRSNVESVTDILEKYTEGNTLDDKMNFDRTVKRRIGNLYLIEDIPEALLFQGPFIKKEDVAKVIEILEDENKKRSGRKEMIPIKQAAKELGMSQYVLKGVISDGKIKALKIGPQTYLEEKEIQGFLKKSTEYIGVIDFVRDEVLPEAKTVWDIEERTNRNTLNIFLKNNPRIASELVTWESVGLHGDRKNSYYFRAEIKDLVKQEILNYLRGYGLKRERLDMYLKDPYWEKHPITREIFNVFSLGQNVIGVAALAEILVEAMPSEITLCTNKEVEDAIKYACAQRTDIYEATIVLFLKYVKKKYNPRFTFTVDYDNNQRHKAINTDPYSRQEYYQISVMVFDDRYIQCHDMLEKALTNSKYAALWLYCSWFFVGAWRANDIFGSLPILQMPDPADEVFERIRNGNFREEAVVVSMLLESEIMGKRIRPAKTKNRQKKRELTIVIPETLRSIIGTIYTINCMHHKKEKVFPEYRFSIKDYVLFFGNEYREIFGNSVLSIRRANKAFLTEVAAIVEEGKENRVMGYAVASYARAHSSGNNKELPPVTSIYLKHELDGLTVNEVLTLLFEAGTCSFIPYMLLKVLYGEDYIKLTVDKQNAVLVQSGLVADTTEQTLLAITKNYAQAQAAVARIICAGSEQQQHDMAVTVLENILNREALAKQPCMACLRMAAKLPCAYPVREGCVGCQYGILEKGVLFILLNQIREKLDAMEKAKSNGEKKKLEMIIEAGYVPAFYEILSVLKEIYHMDISGYIEKFTDILGNETSSI